jgi:alpha-ketoglutarate-dependent taurine dioxygenase
MDNVNETFINQEHFPLVFKPAESHSSKEELLNFVKTQNEYLKKILLKYGAVLFRGFDLKDASDFEDLIKEFNAGKFIDYIGGDSPRTKVHGSVYTSTEAPPSLKIPLHNELSFVKKYPSHIYFFCEIEPKEAGQTIIADCRKIFNAIDPKIRNNFNKKGLRYISRYFYKDSFISKLSKGSHKSWVTVFETHDKNEVERICKENDFYFKWQKKDWIEVSQIRPATILHPKTSEHVWFNQAHLYHFNARFLGFKRFVGAKIFYARRYTKLHDIYYADGSKISKKDLYSVMDVLDKHTVSFPWKKGDALILDNVLAMHGRNPFEGKRRILTAMTGL